MRQSTTLVSVIAAVLLLIAGIFFFDQQRNATPAPGNGGQVACTLEAKVCPDGSSVGRTGPNCEFAACPQVATQKTVKIGQRVLINGVYVTPLKVMEDSRCPVDVQCIQAGRVTLNTKVESVNANNTLGQSKELVFTAGPYQTPFAGKQITLVSVAPDKQSKVTIKSTDYVFTFSVTDAQTTTPDYSSLIQVTSPKMNATITSPLIVTGKAVGTWYFEASFPVKLLDATGKQIAATPAQAQGDWMTTDFVPFTATLTFDKPATATGTLVLEKDNPSGLPANDKSISIPVNFAE